MTELRAAYDKGDFDPWNPEPFGTQLTFAEAQAQFMEARRHRRPDTLNAYSLALRSLAGLLPANVGLRDVNASAIQDYVGDKSKSAGTRSHRFRHLNPFFNWCVEEGHLDEKENPMRKVARPKQEQSVAAFLSVDDVEKLVAAVEADFKIKRAGGFVRDGQCLWFKDVILFAVNTGLRRSEICALRWDAVNLDQAEREFVVVRPDGEFVTKNQKDRVVPLAGDALEVVKRLNEQRRNEDERDFVFLMPKETPMKPGYLTKRFKFYVRLAKLSEQFHFHSLRHTTASWLVMRGVPMRIVQLILGHGSIRETERYSHLAPEVMHHAMQEALGKPLE